CSRGRSRCPWSSSASAGRDGTRGRGTGAPTSCSRTPDAIGTGPHEVGAVLSPVGGGCFPRGIRARRHMGKPVSLVVFVTIPSWGSLFPWWYSGLSPHGEACFPRGIRDDPPVGKPVSLVVFVTIPTWGGMSPSWYS